MVATDPVAALRAELDALDRAYTLGHHGRWVANRRADLLDACLQQLWWTADPPAEVTLAALGGYGRRLQLPGSDVDLLLLHEGLEPAELERLSHAIFYPLWDAGFVLGQVVRTPSGCLEAARERLDSLTAMLDARPVVGDAFLLIRALTPVLEELQADPVTFGARLREDGDRRRERFGSCAHLLEPDLKEGSGGLRDVASLGWLRAALGRPLDDAGLLAADELEAVDAGEEFLVRTRSAVHLATGRRTDRLVADLQPEVADGMGFSDRPRLVATDGLMRVLFEHARDVEHAVAGALARLERGRAAATSAPVPATSAPAPAGPVEVLAILAENAEAHGVLTAELRAALASADVPDPVAWSPEVLDAFLRLLRAGSAGAPAIDLLDRTGLLARYLPAWTEVRCRPQRDPYHRYTVDAHLTATWVAMARLLADGADDPLVAEAPDAVVRPDALLLGALLHDVGKIGEGNHVPIGATIADEQLRSMGLDEPIRELAAFMVSHHLLLPDTATRRDLTDEDLILDVAATVATSERLAALSLLARADAEATGPAAWTPWRQALIRELVGKVRHVLERGEMGEALAARLAGRVDRVRESLAGEPEADVDRFVLRMPRAYFLAVDPVRVARHYRTIAPPLGVNEVRTASASGPRAGPYEVLVVATDRPGLLSWIAGALAVGGISILSAQVFTTEDRVAIDLFEVEGAFDAEITEARWREFRTTLRRAIEGSISLERRVEDKRRHYPAPKVRTAITVAVDNEASDFSTVIEVGAPDRIGLLHDVTRTFADLQLSVHVAKVATFDGRVVDAFYVRDGLGRKIIDAGQLAEVERALRERLGPSG
jgi:[protein-PII] uridylyltransferase